MEAEICEIFLNECPIQIASESCPLIEDVYCAGCENENFRTAINIC